MITKIVSFGFKYGLPDGAGMVVDLRSPVWKFRNPYKDYDLRGLPGTHPRVAAYLEKDRRFDQEYQRLLAIVKEGEGVCFLGCVGGKHRSVMLADRIGSTLQIPVEHRNLEKGETNGESDERK